MNRNTPWEGWEIFKEISNDSECSVYEIVRRNGISPETHSLMKVLVFPENDDQTLKNYVEQLSYFFALNNPHILAVEDYEVCDEYNHESHMNKKVLYIREELLTPLESYFSIVTPNEDAIVKIGIDICSVLESYEQLNIIHNAVIPRNIFVSATENIDPVFKLKCLAGASHKSTLSNDNQNQYTYLPFYTSPEKARAGIYNLTADQYSLGMILYRYLNNGRLPFLPPGHSGHQNTAFDRAEALRLKGSIAIPAPVNATGELSHIVLKAIAYKPADRYKSISEFKDSLLKYQSELAAKRKTAAAEEQVQSKDTLPWPDWSIVRQIGRGGYGKVFEVINAEGTSKSAVKIIKIPANEDELNLIRLTAGYFIESTSQYLDRSFETAKEEIAALETFKNHPNIVHLEESKCQSSYDPDEGINRYTIFLRLELLQTIRDYYSGKNISELDIVKMGIDISSALRALESYKTRSGERVFHRDVTPDNILISETIDGKIHFKLNDFGIVRKVKSSFTSRLTEVGKPFFMAPELKKTGKANPTIDVYSLGMSLYFLLNDNLPPFLNGTNRSGPNAVEEAEEERLYGEKAIPAPKHASERLARIVLKAISFDPTNRYQSAAELYQDLLLYVMSYPESVKEYFDIGFGVPALNALNQLNSTISPDKNSEPTESYIETVNNHSDIAPSTSMDEIRRMVDNLSKKIVNLQSQVRPASTVFYLVDQNNPDNKYKLEDANVIGSGRKSTIRIDNKMVSTVHAQIYRANGRWFIVDLDATNGTFINRKRIKSQQPIDIKDGDIIGFGIEEYIFSKS